MSFIQVQKTSYLLVSLFSMHFLSTYHISELDTVITTELNKVPYLKESRIK